MTTISDREQLSYIAAQAADFSDAIMTGCKLVRANLKSANFRGADLAGADLSGADLTGADLRDAVLVGVTAVPQNFSKVSIGGLEGAWSGKAEHRRTHRAPVRLKMERPRHRRVTGTALRLGLALRS